MTSIYFAEFQYCWQIKERPIKQEKNVDPSSKYSHVSHRTILADILRTDWILLQHNPHTHKQIVDSQQRKLYYLCRMEHRSWKFQIVRQISCQSIIEVPDVKKTHRLSCWLNSFIIVIANKIPFTLNTLKHIYLKSFIHVLNTFLDKKTYSYRRAYFETFVYGYMHIWLHILRQFLHKYNCTYVSVHIYTLNMY